MSYQYNSSKDQPCAESFKKDSPSNSHLFSSSQEIERTRNTLFASFAFLLGTLIASCLCSGFIRVYAENLSGAKVDQASILEKVQHSSFTIEDKIKPLVNVNLSNLDSPKPSHQPSSSSANKISNSLNTQIQKKKKNLSENKSLAMSGDTSNLARELSKIKHIDKQTKSQILFSIRKASKETGIPEELILVLIKKESSFRSEVISSQGARGLTQLMPHTAKAYCGLTLRNIMEIDSNISCGSLYLKKLLKEFDGDIRLSLAAYNTGPAFIQRYRSGHGNHKKGFEDCRHLLNRNVVHYAESINNDYSRIAQS